LGEDQVAGPADESLAFARLELEQAGGEKDQLAPRCIVQILHMPLGRFAEEHGPGLERRGSGTGAGHRHFADLDRRVARGPGVDAVEAHAGLDATRSVWIASVAEGTDSCLPSDLPWCAVPSLPFQ